MFTASDDESRSGNDDFACILLHYFLLEQQKSTNEVANQYIFIEVN